MNEIIELVLGYLRGIWRNRWYALGCAWLFCLIGWFVIYRLPDQYEASARVFVDTQSVLRPLMQGMAVNINPDAQIGLVTRTLLSRPNLEKIARMTDLDVRANDPETLDRLIGGLQSRIGLKTNRGDENLYNLTYENRDPRFAKKVVEAVVTVFAENLLGDTRQDTAAAQRFLEKQIKEYETRLVEAEDRLRLFKLKNMGLMPKEGGTYYNRMQQATEELEAIRLEMAQGENRRNSLQQQLGGVKPTLTGADPFGATTTGPTLPLDARIQSLEEKVDELLLRYTDKHPDVVIMRQTIADLRKQREQILAQQAASAAGDNESGAGQQGPTDNPVYQQLKMALSMEEANLASLQTKVGEYEKRRRELQGQVDAVLRVETELTALNRDYELNRSKYNELLARRESARMAGQIEQTDQNVRFRIIDPPRVPSNPSGPNRPLLMSGVLAAGLAAGLALAFLIAQIWPVFDSRRSLMQITNVPVFGSVSAVLPPAVLRRERLLLVAYASLGGMLLMIYAGLLVVETAGLRWPF